MTSRSVHIVAVAYLFFFIIFLWVYFLGSHGDTVLWLNGHRQPFFDVTMPLLTHLGDGWLFSAAVLILLFLRWRSGLVLLGLGILQLFVSWLLKRVIFKGTPRPKIYFAELGISLDFIPGVDVHGYNAFPSGHTMTAFGVATFFVLYTQRLWAGVLALFLAMVAGFSRIYLLQHFLIDVVAGSMVGVLLATTLCFTFRKFLFQDSTSFTV